MFVNNSDVIQLLKPNVSPDLGVLLFGIFIFIPADPKLYKSSATALDFAFDHSDGISYSVIHSKMNWEEAQQSCNSNASELASILDPYSQSLLFLIAQEYGQPMWIGLNSYMVRTHALQTVKLTGTDLNECSHLEIYSNFWQCIA